jgi:outer membrane protein TolC
LAKEIELMSLLYVNMSSQYANDELIKVLSEEIKKSKDIIQIQEKKYSTGQVSQVDILNSRVTLAKIEQDLLTVKNEQSLLQNDFLNILGRPEESYTAKKIEFSTQNFKILSVSELTDLMGKNKPALKSAQAQIESLKSTLNYASMQALPDFQFSAGVTQWNRPNAAPITGLTRDYNFGVSIAIPLFFPMNELQGVSSAKADLQASEDKSKAVLAQATSDLINAHTSFQSLTNELDKMLKVVLPAAKASYQLTLSSYSMGKTDFLRLSESRSNYIQAQKDIITKKRSINQTYVQLLQIVGCDFERKEGPHACN